MKKKKSVQKPKMGAPIKEIDRKNFEGLCAIQCTLFEMQAVLGVCDATIETWCKREYGKTFSEVFKEKKSIGNVSLRRAQFRLAVEKLHPTMLIFLGKDRLGQTDGIQESRHHVITEKAESELESKLSELIESFGTRRTKSS